MGVISFARGVPAPECLPIRELADCARAVFERDGETALNYGPAGGYGPLREWLAERHGVAAGQIVLTNGSLQGLDLVIGHFAAERRLLVEAPTYDRALRTAARRGIDVAEIAHDDEGIDPEALADELARDPRPALLYLLPTFQNPSGRTISLERRRRVLELADAHDLVVLEDDPYRLVRFDGDDVPSLHELGGGGRDPPLVVVLEDRRARAPRRLPRRPRRSGRRARDGRRGHVSRAGLLDAGDRLRVPAQRASSSRTSSACAACCGAGATPCSRRWRRDLPEASWSTPAGGYFLWLELPAGVSAGEALAAGEEAGVTFVAGGDFFVRPEDGAGAARLAFSFASPEEIGEGVARLAGALAATAAA